MLCDQFKYRELIVQQNVKGNYRGNYKNYGYNKKLKIHFFTILLWFKSVRFIIIFNFKSV